MVLDNIIEDDLYLSYDISTYLASDLDLISVFLKHKNRKIFVFLREEMLLKKYEESTLLEYLI